MVSDPFSVEDIARVFPTIKPFIERLYREFGGYPEHKVERLLLVGAATLHLVGEDAFLIAQWSENTCHVLCAASLKGHLDSWPDVISATTSYIKQLGCSKLTFTSPREGWGRVAAQVGFHVESKTYAMEF